GFVHQRPGSAIARFGLRELKPETGAVTRLAEGIAARHDHLDQFVEHPAPDADRPAGMRPGAVAGKAERALGAAAPWRADVEIVGHLGGNEKFVALAERIV